MDDFVGARSTVFIRIQLIKVFRYCGKMHLSSFFFFFAPVLKVASNLIEIATCEKYCIREKSMPYQNVSSYQLPASTG